MADKTIGQLTAASAVTPTDLFVLEQSGTAKKLTGQILENWLVSFADGHGGIQTIEKTSTSGLVDTYTITLADTTTMTFTVTNGKGIQSIATYWAVSSNGTTPPTNWSLTRQNMTATNRYLWSYQAITYNDGTQGATTQSVVGVYGDKGNKGDTGNGISNLVQTGRDPGVSTTYTFTMTDGTTKSFLSYDGAGIADIERTSTAGLVDTYTVTMTNGETDTFTVTNAKSIESVSMVSGTHAPGTTDTYRITFNDGDTTDFTVYNGTNGTGSVSTVDGIPAISQNVTLLLTGNGAPTTSTAGQLHQRYFDLSNHVLYICTAIDTSGAETTYTWSGTGVAVDDALSTMSTNPVQNAVITNKVGAGALSGFTATNLTGAANELMQKKADKTATVSNVAYDSQNHLLKKTINGTESTVLEVDTSPTADSMNPIASDAVAELSTDLNIYPNVSMFQQFAVLGDSFASGAINGTVYYTESWARMLADLHGVNAYVYAQSGASTADFLDSSKSWYNIRGYGAIAYDDGQNRKSGLFLICLGVNDANNDSTSSNIGSSSDIRTDPETNPNTFWGNYGKLIKRLQGLNANAKIICCGFKRAPSSLDPAYANYNAAIQSIAQYFSLPYLNPADHEFFNSDYYLTNMVSNHPTAPLYSAYAKAMSDLISKTIKSYNSYFANYNGSNIYPNNRILLSTHPSISVPNSTIVTAEDVVLQKGTYLFVCTAEFAANATGYRRLGLSGSTTVSYGGRYLGVDEWGTADHATRCFLTTLHTVTSDNYHMYLNLLQNSGSTLTCNNPGMIIFKLA